MILLPRGTPACWPLLLLPLLPLPLRAQEARRCWTAPNRPADSARALLARTAYAVRLSGPAPRIDGRLDERVWCTAPVATDFVQSGPAPGALATLPTMVRVLFDDEAVYVAMRLTDPAPDSIVAPFPRRDDETTSDWAFVEIDSRYDHRSGFSFGVNPRGVQADGAWSDDVNYDGAWNGVWESAARIDSLGWTVEYRISFAQLALSRGRPEDPLPWGVNFYRYIPHRGESDNWSPRLPSVVGVISHFNELRGLTVPPRQAAGDLVGYLALAGAHALPDGAPGPVADGVSTAAGADLRLRPIAGTTVALSLHPDFGQVEADPSQVNLTTFETFLPEQRPLFVEGRDVFQFASALPFASRGTSFALESPFYSRRIGRAPRLGCPAPALHCRVPHATTLLGAARVSARSGAGWAGGVFQAWTRAEYAAYADTAGAGLRVQSEPLTSFNVARLVREMSRGRAALGVIATSVDRFGMAPRTDSLLPRHAAVAGMDGRLRVAAERYELSGFALASRVAGSTEAIDALRREPLHAGGAGAAPGEERVFGGLAAQGRLARIAGRLLWSLAGRVVTRDFESNDVGFQRNADWILATGSWTYKAYRPGHAVRRWSVGSSQAGLGWTTAGVLRAAVVNATTTADLASYWGGSISLDHEFPAADPEVLRGGPALRLPARDRWTVSAYTDSRQRRQATLELAGAREPGSRSSALALTPLLTGFVTDRLQLGLSPSVEWVREGWQYVDQPRDGNDRPHYILGALRQTTGSLTARVTYAVSARCTLQLYAQAFASSGRYGEFKEVVDGSVTPLGSSVEDDSAAHRYIVHGGQAGDYVFADPSSARSEFHLNALLRWEFLPGSTLFLVWTQERAGQDARAGSLDSAARALWHTPAANTVVLKVSYRMGR